MNAYDMDEIKQDYVIGVFKFLKLRPIYTITKPERYFTYFLILKELKEFEEYEILENVKRRIISGDTIHKIFIELVENDDTTILNYFKSEIDHYKEEDFTSIFFGF